MMMRFREMCVHSRPCVLTIAVFILALVLFLVVVFFEAISRRTGPGQETLYGDNTTPSLHPFTLGAGLIHDTRIWTQEDQQSSSSRFRTNANPSPERKLCVLYHHPIPRLHGASFGWWTLLGFLFLAGCPVVDDDGSRFRKYAEIYEWTRRWQRQLRLELGITTNLFTC